MDWKHSRLRTTLIVSLSVIGMAVIAAFVCGWQYNRAETKANPAAASELASEPAVAGGRLAAAKSAGPVSVTAAPVSQQQVQRSVGAVGTFYGFDEVTVTAEVSGRVVRVLHDVGDRVQPGEVLLHIDPTDYELAVEETRRAIELEATRIGLREHIPADEHFTAENVMKLIQGQFKPEQLPSVVGAREQLENADRRLARAVNLLKQNSLSDEDYTQRVTDLKVAQAAYEQAGWDAWSVVAGIKYRLVQLRTAQRKLDLTQVPVPTPTQRTRMPKDVRYAVVERMVTEGEMVKDAGDSSTATFKLVMDGALKLNVDVPERFVNQLHVGQPAQVWVDAFAGRAFPGEVIRINPLIDRTNRTFTVEVAVDNVDRELKAGGFAKVDILTHVDPHAWTVPIESVVTYAGSTRIFLIREGRAVAMPVTTGLAEGKRIELILPPDSGLRLEDRVITSGHEQLAEGIPVVVREEQRPSPRSPEP